MCLFFSPVHVCIIYKPGANTVGKYVTFKAMGVTVNSVCAILDTAAFLLYMLVV